jgi:hypothetical protein
MVTATSDSSVMAEFAVTLLPLVVVYLGVFCKCPYFL